MTDWSVLCRDIVDCSPFPLAAVVNEQHTVLYGNAAFWRLAGEDSTSVNGRSVADCVPQCTGCVALLADVRASGTAKQQLGTPPDQSRMYSAWPLPQGSDGVQVTMLQITESSEFAQRTSALNESLMMTAVAQHETAEAAVANALLLGDTITLRTVELDRTKEELRFLAVQLLQAQEDERRRIARELHDSVSQQLAFVSMELFQFEAEVMPETGHVALSRVASRVAAISTEVRTLSHQLHSSVLEDLGLEAALHALLQDFENAHRIPVRLTVTAWPAGLPLLTTTTIFRIVQEALANVLKHAGPDVQLIVELISRPGDLLLRVEDTGVGFDAQAARGQGGLGMISMQERALLVGGSLWTVSAPGKGTAINLLIPTQL